MTRIVLRPVASSLPLGFLAFGAGSRWAAAAGPACRWRATSGTRSSKPRANRGSAGSYELTAQAGRADLTARPSDVPSAGARQADLDRAISLAGLKGGLRRRGGPAGH